MKLTSELVPKTAWYSNVRSNVTRAEWDVIRHQVYANADNICEICGGKGKHHAVECHEVWEYDDDTNIQKLVRMIALCPACHSVKHLGRARAVGIYNEALAQLQKVNGITANEARAYSSAVFAQWKERSKYKWKLDIKNLNQYTNQIKKTGKNDAW